MSGRRAQSSASAPSSGCAEPTPEGVAKSSGFDFPPETPELGYVAVDANHKRRGLSHRIVAELLSKRSGPLFATTDKEAMRIALDRAGFVRKGKDWQGKHLAAEDAAVFAGIWIAYFHPIAFLVALAVFVVLAIWLLPKLWQGVEALWRLLRTRTMIRRTSRGEEQVP